MAQCSSSARRGPSGCRGWPATDVVLTFAGGVVVVAHGAGATTVLPWLAEHGGDAGRVAHLGVGLNPRVRGRTGWVLLDEHRSGAVFLALGENRYMGGSNASALNHDVVLDDATLLLGGDHRSPFVVDGQLAPGPRRQEGEKETADHR